jgi:hypothetical protein
MIKAQIENSTINFKMGKMVDMREDLLYHSLCSSVRQDDHFNILFIFKMYSVFLNKQVHLILTEEKKLSRRSNNKNKLHRKSFKNLEKSVTQRMPQEVKISVFGPDQMGEKKSNIYKSLRRSTLTHSSRKSEFSVLSRKKINDLV